MKNRLAFLKSRALAVGLFLSSVALPCQPINATWQPAEIISNPAQPVGGNGADVVLSVNPQGNAIVVWKEEGNPVWGQGFDTITTNFYNRGVGWQGPVIVSSLAMNSFGENLYDGQRNPSIAMNSSNYAVAVWEADYLEDPFPFVIVATVRQPNGIWQPVQNINVITTSSILVDNVNVALNEAGTAVAAWKQQDGNTGIEHIVVSILPYGGSWSTPLLISEPGTGDVFGENKPYVVNNEAGDIIVVYQRRYPDGSRGIDAVTYNAVMATWSLPVHLDVGGDFSETPRCAIDENGNGVAIWNQDGAIKTAYFTYGSGWGPSEVIGSGDTKNPAIVMDPAGNATTTWSNFDGEILSAFRPVGGVWSAPQVISVPGTYSQQEPRMSQEPLAVDADGNVITIWFDDSRVIYSAYRLFGQPWQAPEIIFDSVTDEFYENIGLASCGFAVAAWEVSGGDEGVEVVMAAVNENILAPFGLRYSRCSQRFATQKVSVDLLAWETTAECILFYNIYCNGTLLAVVPGNAAHEFTYKSCRNCNYTLTTINVWGFESDPVPFILE